MLNNPALFLFAAIAIPAGFLAIRYWQGAIFSVFVLMVFEGALRKWVFPWAQAQIYLLKDAILLAAYVGFLIYGRRNQKTLRGLDAIKVVLLLAFAVGCLQIFNPNSPSILIGLIGVKNYFLYAPLAFILPYAIESREHLLRLIRNYLIMAIPIAVLGFVQVVAGPHSSLNTYVGNSEGEQILATFGHKFELVRSTGTFSYISGYTAFLTFVSFLGIAYNMSRGWRVKNNIVPLLALTLIVGAMFTTGSRSPVYTLVAAGPIILWLGAIRGIIPVQVATRICIVLPVIALAAVGISSEAFEGFMVRATAGESDDTSKRIMQLLGETFAALASAPLGIGIGSTHPSALAIMGTDWAWWLQGLAIETELARVTAELGFIGLVLINLLRFLIVWFALRCAMAFKDPTYRAFGIVLMVHLAIGILFSSITLNMTAGLYYWGALGIIITMRRLEQSTREQAGRAVVPSQTRFVGRLKKV